jgi:hypothetical protein
VSKRSNRFPAAGRCCDCGGTQDRSMASQAYTSPDGISRARCRYCGHCSLFECMVGGKASPNFTLLPIVRGRKYFEARTYCQVRRA